MLMIRVEGGKGDRGFKGKGGEGYYLPLEGLPPDPRDPIVTSVGETRMVIAFVGDLAPGEKWLRTCLIMARKALLHGDLRSARLWMARGGNLNGGNG